MKPLVGLADLARVVASFSRDDARDVAVMLGFESAPKHTLLPRMAPTIVEPPPEPTPQERFDKAVAQVESQRAMTDDPAVFWRVSRYIPPANFGKKPRSPSRRKGRTPAEIRGDGRSLFATPESPPLVPWKRLWPRLQTALHAVRHGSDPDVAGLVRRVSRGEPVSRIPRVRRRAWADRASLWIDRSPRLVPLWEDQSRVVRGLRKVFGRSLEVRWLDNRAHATAAHHRRGWLAGYRTDAARPVVILSDLGGSDDAAHARWCDAITGICAAGARVTALVPTRERRRPLPRHAHITPWERAAPTTSDPLETLLTVVAMTSFVQPGLLRVLRWLVPGASVETELHAWNHSAVEAADATGLILRTEQAKERRVRFATLDEGLQERVSELLRRWRAETPRELSHAEALAWQASARKDTPNPGDLPAAIAFMERLATTLASSDTARTELDGLKHYGRATLDAMPASAYQTVPALGRVWDVAYEGVQNAVPPEGVDIAAIRAERRRNAKPTTWALRQVGDELEFTPRDDARWPSEDASPGSPVAILEAVGTEVFAPSQQLLSGALTVSLRQRQSVAIDASRGRVVVEPWERPRWATRAGRDRFGLWASFMAQGVECRMRWIPPGRFVMGAPQGEAGRVENEGPQHEVVLTEGYWLGETLVTQALWTAVMRQNPSKFKDAERPVEQVNWEDCQRFILQLNGSIPQIGVRLPTEAEWEYGCRAGTQTATWVGDLTVTTALRTAPELDAIAWYYGNAGRTTHVVRGKAPNPFGLYDMLGNVWEWCADWSGRLANTPLINPRGISMGIVRVLRGGSWLSGAGFVHASTRAEFVPAVRNDYVGFRLAGGQV